MQKFFSQKGAKFAGFCAIEGAFWLFIFFALEISYFAAAQYLQYDHSHDHHLPFFLFLSGMASHGILPGIDFYSPHSVFVPIILGAFLKIVGINQVNLSLGVGICVFITFIFIYKTARLVLPNLWAKFAILILLLSFPGRDLPWFNDVLFAFVAAGIYFFASFIKDKKQWRLIALGFVCFCLPYLRQQCLVILVCFLSLPMILYYLNAIPQNLYRSIMRLVLATFLALNVAFFIFILAWNGFSGLEILFSSLTKMVAMAQPLQGYPADFSLMFYKLFNYSFNGGDWHGEFMRFLSYWLIVIFPCIYFVYRPIALFFAREAILNEDSIRFVTALITLSTIVFNYPIQEDARMKAQFALGIWLFIDALLLIFYHKKARIASILAIFVVVAMIHNLKFLQYTNMMQYNIYNVLLRTKAGHIKMDKSTPYTNLAMREAKANELISIVESLREYKDSHPQKAIVFDGELESITQYLSLLWTKDSANRNIVALAHKFPYYYGAYIRTRDMSDIDERFRAFVAQESPIIITCTEMREDRVINPLDRVENYEILRELGDLCAIIIPKED